jgi:hypothetical protein
MSQRDSTNLERLVEVCSHLEADITTLMVDARVQVWVLLVKTWCFYCNNLYGQHFIPNVAEKFHRYKENFLNESKQLEAMAWLSAQPVPGAPSGSSFSK